MPSFLQRMKERKLVQWALAYLAGAWVLFEVSDVVGGHLAWPEPLYRGLLIILAVGLFVTLVLAWYHGERGHQRVSGPELLMISLLLVIAGAGLFVLRSRGPTGSRLDESPETLARTSDDRPFVAALPLVNLSPVSEDAYLASAFHEELITQLYKIGGLRVVSRTSVMEYREPDRNLRQIASELGVNSVVEGSVQKVQERIHINVQLIDAETDEHLWAQQYDRAFSLDNLLDVQAEIAQEIALALRAELTPEDQARLSVRHSDNWDAYQAYLRGLYFLHRPHYTSEDVTRALQEFERAVELDPTFALAWAELSVSHAQKVYFWTDASEERREMARRAADRALAAGEPSAEVRLALALAQLYLDRDAERALEEIAVAARELPNDPAVIEARSAALEIQGRFQESIDGYRLLQILNPREPTVHTHLAFLNWVTRNFTQAEADADHALSLAPDHLWTNLAKIMAVWFGGGPTEETRVLADGLTMRSGWVVWARYWDRMMMDEYQAAIQCLREWEDEWVRTKMWAGPLPLYEALAYRAMEDTDRAAAAFREATALLEAETRAHPYDPRYHSSLGLAYAGLGRREEAVREGERAVALLPLSRDAFYALGFLWDMAAIHTMTGNEDAAIRQIEELLAIPSFVSLAFLEHEFRFDPLRDNPGYQAVLERYGSG